MHEKRLTKNKTHVHSEKKRRGVFEVCASAKQTALEKSIPGRCKAYWGRERERE